MKKIALMIFALSFLTLACSSTQNATREIASEKNSKTSEEINQGFPQKCKVLPSGYDGYKDSASNKYCNYGDNPYSVFIVAFSIEKGVRYFFANPKSPCLSTEALAILELSELKKEGICK